MCMLMTLSQSCTLHHRKVPTFYLALPLWYVIDISDFMYAKLNSSVYLPSKLLPLTVFSISLISSVQLLISNTLDSSLTSLSHTPPGSRIYPESDHSHLHGYHLVYLTIVSCLDDCSSLLNCLPLIYPCTFLYSLFPTHGSHSNPLYSKSDDITPLLKTLQCLPSSLIVKAEALTMGCLTSQSVPG